MIDSIRLHENDNVQVATNELEPGRTVTGITIEELIPAGHKFSSSTILNGEAVLKYGQVIGKATETIFPGKHVHTHNVDFFSSNVSSTGKKHQEYLHRVEASFSGYLRENGKAGTRNFVGVLATVNCASTVVAKAAQIMGVSELLIHPNIDNVVPIVHQSGCGIPASTKDELGSLQRLLSGYINHPNFYGWVIVGLGCEVNQIETLLQSAGTETSDRIRTVEIQSEGGTQSAIKAAVNYATELVEGAVKCERQLLPASELVLGLQCGGSDAWSGITANPALGYASDLLIGAGGSSILAETPEIYGAEQLLFKRTANQQVKNKLQAKIDWWTRYLSAAKTDLNNNPSPGNLKGGITTILEKSLGAVAKSGRAELVDVLDYAEPLKTKGLNFMDSPGFDPCSVTGEISSGANIICFTTGRGSTFGSAGAPCLKIASNSHTYLHMKDDMDINAGGVVDEGKSVEDVGKEIWAEILNVASGKLTFNESLGLGNYEFVPWQRGVVV